MRSTPAPCAFASRQAAEAAASGGGIAAHSRITTSTGLSITPARRKKPKPGSQAKDQPKMPAAAQPAAPSGGGTALLSSNWLDDDSLDDEGFFHGGAAGAGAEEEEEGDQEEGEGEGEDGNDEQLVEQLQQQVKFLYSKFQELGVDVDTGDLGGGGGGTEEEEDEEEDRKSAAAGGLVEPFEGILDGVPPCLWASPQTCGSSSHRTIAAR